MSTDPTNDNTTKYASKTRVERIPLTYYYKNDPVDKTKLALTVVAILGFGAWAAFGLVADPKQHSPGPVASVHAMWNTQCSACHKDFRPTSGDAFAVFGNQEQLSLLGPDSRHGAIQCTQCHAGGAHLPT
jgi:mono/diheme cytochrome c family protein